LDKIADS